MERGAVARLPFILLANDDGYDAPGLSALEQIAKPYGDLCLAAPEYPQSGMSQAITSTTPLRARAIYPERGYSCWAINGTPTDCVKLAALTLLDRLPDLVVSGINHGSNSSANTLYSGTVAAALEGAHLGIPSIAFSSLDRNPNKDFTSYIPYCKELIQLVLKHGLPEGVALNVNLPVEDPKGLRFCRQAKGRWTESFARAVDPRGEEYYWLTGHFVNLEPEAADTDEYALERGYISVVPINVDCTDRECLEEMKGWKL